MSNLTNFQKLIKAFTDELNLIETEYYSLLVNRSLNTATGAQLDGIGDILGLERNGLSDDAYRIALKGQIQINKSTATSEELIQLAFQLTNPTRVQLTDLFPAKCVLTIMGGSKVGLVQPILKEVAAGGVDVYVYKSEDAFAFGFGDIAGPTGPEDDPYALGFSEVGYLTGGKFTEVLH